ncbi:Bug family tripartite tricarboxylate transporter substrate binding protein [Noviherbaspirillum sp. Root189]|uniref:Bug family tripartite tricarboxylate transporter substrate binding protein n=1 Tax=Noviherbaspirillum sp. Root189 TaxID=1736487 RepID=UPI00070C3E03|nr:tripartite tricarboxylate transporter substrate binding protein [Noviherbaspirillum sp. Root189]KRB93516.1 ABC transporter substrate-binding protein [Noviherbaspirillum sp. Root189]
MIIKSKRSFLRYSVALATALLAGATWAQSGSDWPTRPVTIVVGFSAGGPTDAVARILAEQLSAKFNQSFVVENKAGASGALAAVGVKKAAPDGYTLMFGSSSTLSITPHLQKNLGYDPLRDFTAIGLVASYPYFLVAPASSAITSLDELLKRGGNPSFNLSYASAGNGAVNHLAGEWFKHVASIKATHIPYKGDSAALVDLVAGRTDFAFLSGAAVLPQVKSGKLRLLASASATSGRGGEGVITLGESRFKGFAAEPWNGLMGPAGMPQSIVVRLNAAVNEIMNRKEVVDRLAAMEQYPLTGTPQQFTNHIKEQTERWASVIKTSDIKVD